MPYRSSPDTTPRNNLSRSRALLLAILFKCSLEHPISGFPDAGDAGNEAGPSIDASAPMDILPPPADQPTEVVMPPMDVAEGKDMNPIDAKDGADVIMAIDMVDTSTIDTPELDKPVSLDKPETAIALDTPGPSDLPIGTDTLVRESGMGDTTPPPTDTPEPQDSVSRDAGTDVADAVEGGIIDMPTPIDRPEPTDSVTITDTSTVDSSLPSNGCRVSDITDTRGNSRCTTGTCIIPRGLGVVSHITLQFGSDAPSRIDRALIDSVTPAESAFTYTTSPAPGYGRLTTNTTAPGTAVAIRGLSLQTNRGIRNCGDAIAVIE